VLARGQRVAGLSVGAIVAAFEQLESDQVGQGTVNVDRGDAAAETSRDRGRVGSAFRKARQDVDDRVGPGRKKSILTQGQGALALAITEQERGLLRLPAIFRGAR